MFKCATPARLPFGRAYKAPQSFLARTKKANKRVFCLWFFVFCLPGVDKMFQFLSLFFCCPGQYIALGIFIGPSEWQPGGRRTFIHWFFRRLLPLCMGRILPVNYYKRPVGTRRKAQGKSNSIAS